ncbi:Pimeloyl-ACP methyl ester carboxylesterase [Filimonas lacunae]|uniref:Pimeloyl-ACP methyl ester carboxylesterase n=1 Tax=Filimonas lacunae TaxID=477680 RepID=A0A173MG16_9BACT|nr:alpha/beta hydrolase [Filimonas lacunae]BAV06429.1 hydrolase, alpha/beta hydrolase fold family [Filimonas lacunae]SIT26923.1 Pimeloyl-ACP methyl ester carboxylesterase [Filimonas lacunae]
MKCRSILLSFLFILCCSQGQAQSAFNVKVVGKGSPILLFPGFACTGDLWQGVTSELSKHYECHIFTFAGFGDVPPIGKPWLPNIKDSVIKYVNNHKIYGATIIGHSLGGTLGLWLAATEPAMFKKIIVVDALPCTGALMMPGYKSENIVYDNPYSKKIREMDSAAFLEMAKQQTAYIMLNKEKKSQVVEWIMKADRSTYVDGYVDLLKLDLRADLTKIKIPVVILAATYPNKAAIEKNYNEQYANLNEKTIYYADNAAHFIMYDQPEWFLSKITESLR